MKRQISVVAAGMLVALAAAVYALAGHDVGSVPSFTGCIKAGKLVKLKPGEEPKSACAAGELEAHLSGGDVTAVLAGTGLIGGGAEGPLVLRADPAAVQSRVTGACVNSPRPRVDEAINRINQDGTVACNEDDGFTGYSRVVAGSGSYPGGPKAVAADCPQGTKVIGGGGYVPYSSLRITLSWPEWETRWTVYADQDETESRDWAVTAYAICAVVD